MKTLLLWAIGCLLSTSAAWAQTTWLWAESVPNVQVNDVATNLFGDVFVTGSFQVPVTFSSPYFKGTLTPVGTRDLFLARFDALGRVKWARQVGGSGANASGTALALDGLGSAYVVGTFTDDTLTVNTGAAPLAFVPGSLSNIRTCVLKYATATGTVEWSRRGGGGGPDSRNCVPADVAASPSGCYVIGNFGSRAVFEQVMLSGLRQSSVFVASYSPAGALRWANASKVVTNGPAPISVAQAQAASIALDAAGDCYVTGRYFFGDFELGGLLLPYSDYTRLFVTRLAGATGVAQWTRGVTAPPAGPDRADGTSIAVFGNACYVGGTALGALQFDSTQTATSSFEAPTARGYLARYHTQTGTLSWIRPLLDATAPVEVAVTIGRVLTSSTVRPPAGGAAAATVWAHRPNGDYLWTTQVSGGNSSGLAVLGPVVYLAGAYSGTVSFGPHTLTAPAEGGAGYVAQLWIGGRITFPAAPSEAPALLAFPNPATDELRLQLAEGTRGVVLLDQFGHVVRQQAGQALHTSLDVRSLAPGLYWLRYESAKGRGAVAVEIKH